MLVRVGLGAVVAASMTVSAVAGSMSADEARRFVSGKVFSYTCFDGTRGAGRFFDDGAVGGSIQFSGSGPTRFVRLPTNTIQVRSGAVCASIKGLPFDPCFNLTKNDERSFRGAVSGMGFAYCDFKHQGGASMLMARAERRARGPRAITPDAAKRSDVEPVGAIETPRVDAAKIDPVKPAPTKTDSRSEAKTETKVETTADASLNLRKSTD
jgi:hypothetical protein